MALKIIQQFSKWMRYLNDNLIRLTLKSTAEENVSHLFYVAEYYASKGQYNQAHSVYEKYIRFKFQTNGLTRTYSNDSLFFSEEECAVMAVSKANFESIAKGQPQIISRLTMLLAEWLWSLYRQLASTLITDPLGRMYDTLLLHLEKNQITLDIDEPYTFNFGAEELIQMVGLSQKEGSPAIQKIA